MELSQAYGNNAWSTTRHVMMYDNNLLTSLHGEVAHRTPDKAVVKVGQVQLTTVRVHRDGTISLNKIRQLGTP